MEGSTTTSPITNTTSDRILNYDIGDEDYSAKAGQQKKKQVRIVDKRHRMKRRNAISVFIMSGKNSIKRIFPNNTSPDKVVWNSISPKFFAKKERNASLKKSQSVPVSQSPTTISKHESLIRQESIKESIRPLNYVSVDEITTDRSIFSSCPIISMINEYNKEAADDVDEENMDELFEHWISNFVDTCKRQIKNVTMSTNTNLSQYMDLNNSTLITGQHNFVEIQTIPTWSQIRILQDKSKQRYIALKKSPSVSWFVLPRESPKLNQRWICYPIISMNTFENELKMIDENSIEWMLLRMIVLKCFNKIARNDVPVKFDTNNILLVISSCGLIVVFKESLEELHIGSFGILKSETLADVLEQWGLAKIETKAAVLRYFYRLDIISVLISSIWPLDLLAYLLATLMMESEK